MIAAALIGTFDGTEEIALRNALERAGASVICSPGVEAIKPRLVEARPTCICVNGTGSELETTTSWLREHQTLYATPVIALVSDLKDQLFIAAYRGGADDVIVRSNDSGVTRRIANLSGFSSTTRPPTTQGLALIGHDGHNERRTIGRVLRQAGFEVSFATNFEEVVSAIGAASAPRLIIASEDIVPSDAIDKARSHALASRYPLPFIIITSNANTRTTLDPSLESVAIVSASAPPDHLLFLANDLRGGYRTQQRQSPRFLFDALCSFRAEGNFESEYGLTYNISGNGIYVRTLDPPPRTSRLWIELRPPGTNSTVQLRGSLVWRTVLDAGPRATPPGFGLKIDDETSSPRDLELYRNAYYARAAQPNEVEIS